MLNEFFQDIAMNSNIPMERSLDKATWDRARVIPFGSKFTCEEYPSTNDNLEVAAENGRLEVVALLLKDRQVDPVKDNFAVGMAAKNGHLKVLALLLEDRQVYLAADNFAIGMAARNGHLKVLALLLKDGRVNPAARDNLAFRAAAENGHLEVVALLL